MVLSFSRPDPSSPSAVAGASFSSARRGFDQAEVRDFLRMVSAEMSRLQERVVFLERELKDGAKAQPLVHADMTEATIAELLGEETARIIEAAREAAHKIRERSEEAASRITKEASEEAARIREETELECSRRRQDATSDAEAEILMAKQQGREMVNEARAYRERVLADVARRREMAREQLQDLHHGRERLVHAFERARTATDDVLRDLIEPADEPMEFVNLAPTTGPVPVIVQADDIERLEAVRPPSSAPRYSSEHPSVSSPDDDLIDEVDAGTTDVDDVVDVEGVATDHEDVVVPHVVPVEHPVDDGADASDAVDVFEVAQEDEHEDTEPVSNVVPLFARVEDRAKAPEVEVPPPTERRPAVDAGDIFERLRRANTESVAAEASRRMPRPVEQSSPTTGQSSPTTEQSSPTTEQSSPTTEQSSPTTGQSPASVEPRRTELTAEDAKILAIRNELLVPVIVAMSRMAKRVLADEQNQVLDILRGKPVIRSLDSLVGSRTEHVGRYVVSLKNLLGEAALAGARSLSDEPESDLVKKIEPQVLQIHEYVEATLVDPLRERLQRSMSQSSESNAELASLVRLVYREWKNQYIDEHMDDVALMAYGRGAAAVLNPSMRVCWRVDPNGPACADAEDNSLGGFIPGGDEFPTGHIHAPAHPGCRCVLVSDQN